MRRIVGAASPAALVGFAMLAPPSADVSAPNRAGSQDDRATSRALQLIHIDHLLRQMGTRLVDTASSVVAAGAGIDGAIGFAPILFSVHAVSGGLPHRVR